MSASITFNAEDIVNQSFLTNPEFREITSKKASLDDKVAALKEKISKLEQPNAQALEYLGQCRAILQKNHPDVCLSDPVKFIDTLIKTEEAPPINEGTFASLHQAAQSCFNTASVCQELYLNTSEILDLVTQRTNLREKIITNLTAEYPQQETSEALRDHSITLQEQEKDALDTLTVSMNINKLAQEILNDTGQMQLFVTLQMKCVISLLSGNQPQPTDQDKMNDSHAKSQQLQTWANAHPVLAKETILEDLEKRFGPEIAQEAWESYQRAHEQTQD